jgi:4-hydroxybenzoate polyprenyltransferase
MAVGAFWARSLGCLYNDWVDRDLDCLVSRTAHRPLIGYRPSLFFLCLTALCSVVPGLFFLWILPIKAIGVAILGAVGALVYPFCKRWTMYPQLFLGLVFNVGVFIPAMIQGVPLSRGLWILYACGISWTLVYDALYAYQDYKDDLRVGIGSVAVSWGLSKGKYWLACFCLLRYALLALLASSLSALMVLALMALWEGVCLCTLRLESPQECAKAFQRTKWQGVVISIWLVGIRLLF